MIPGVLQNLIAWLSAVGALVIAAICEYASAAARFAGARDTLNRVRLRFPAVQDFVGETNHHLADDHIADPPSWRFSFIRYAVQPQFLAVFFTLVARSSSTIVWGNVAYGIWTLLLIGLLFYHETWGRQEKLNCKWYWIILVVSWLISLAVLFLVAGYLESGT
jgi:hypothetical protein